jgi:hypothetical protein
VTAVLAEGVAEVERGAEVDGHVSSSGDIVAMSSIADNVVMRRFDGR